MNVNVNVLVLILQYNILFHFYIRQERGNLGDLWKLKITEKKIRNG